MKAANLKNIVLLAAAVAALSACGTGTVIYHLAYIDTVDYTEVRNILALVLQTVGIDIQVLSLNTDQCTLNSTVSLQVANHLIHNRGRNSEAITTVGSCL